MINPFINMPENAYCSDARVSSHAFEHPTVRYKGKKPPRGTATMDRGVNANASKHSQGTLKVPRNVVEVTFEGGPYHSWSKKVEANNFNQPAQVFKEPPGGYAWTDEAMAQGLYTKGGYKLKVGTRCYVWKAKPTFVVKGGKVLHG